MSDNVKSNKNDVVDEADKAKQNTIVADQNIF
jgi:hypothetical protein